MRRTRHAGAHGWRKARAALLSPLALSLFVRSAGAADAPVDATATPSAALAAPAQSGARSLSLEEALRTALSQHPRLRVARANLAASEARVARARAPLLPQVVASASYQRATANAASRGAQASTDTPQSLRSYDYFSAGVSANQLVTDFGQASGRRRVAEASRDVQRKSTETDRQDLAFTVRSTFFQARAQRALLAVAEETLENQRRHLASVSGFVEVGSRPPIDRVQAEADVQRAELNRVNAENAYAIAKARLVQAMGLDAPFAFEVASDSVSPLAEEDAATGQLYVRAVAARPELQAALGTLRVQELSLDAAEAGYFPSLNVSASMTEAGPELSRLRWNASVGANLTWPLFEGGATRAEVRESRANVDAASAQAMELRQQLLFEVEQARLGVLGAKLALSTAEKLLTISRERLVLAEGRYQTGVGNLLELSDAQLGLTNAQGDRVQAEFNLASARVSLQRALGQP